MSFHDLYRKIRKPMPKPTLRHGDEKYNREKAKEEAEREISAEEEEFYGKQEREEAEGI
jgi:hypothetical protein